LRTASGRCPPPTFGSCSTTNRSTATDWPWCSCSGSACMRWNPARPAHHRVIHRLSSPSMPRRHRASRRATQRHLRRTVSRCATAWQHKPRTVTSVRGSQKIQVVERSFARRREAKFLVCAAYSACTESYRFAAALNL